MKKNIELGETVFNDTPARLHDRLYLEAPPETIKSSYVQVARLLEHFFEKKPDATLVEMGCATGDFANYLQKCYPSVGITGIDYHEELLDEANRRYPHMTFKQGSILDESCIKNDSADVITVLGVISMFDDVSQPLRNCTRWLRRGGYLLVFNMFNKYPIDTWMRYEVYNSGRGKEVGWNIPSQARIENILANHGMKNICFVDFEVNFDRAFNEKDPMRTWTVRLNDTPMMINATWIVHPFKFLLAEKE